MSRGGGAVSAAPAVAPSAPLVLTLPLVAVERIEISGEVVEQGQATADAAIDLYLQYEQFRPQLVASTQTGSDGMYHFSEIPAPMYGEHYYVCYENEPTVPDRLAYYCSAPLYPFSAGASYTFAAIEIRAYELLAPPDNSTVTLPVTLTWTARPDAPGEHYLLWIACGPGSIATLDVGYTDHYVVDSASPHLEYTACEWSIDIQNPDYSIGLTNNWRSITFLPAVSASETAK